MTDYLGYDQPWYSFSSSSSIKIVVIEDGVTSIGNMAFYYCYNLTSITLPASVTTIGRCAFQFCLGLTSITLPESLMTIGIRAFYGCTSLTSITLPANVINIFRDGPSIESPFSYCFGLTSIEVASDNPAYSSENGVLFNKAKTELIACPAGKLGSCTIPASVTSIIYNAFDYCTRLTSIEAASDNPAYSSENGVLFNKTKTELIAWPPSRKLGSYALPNSITTIGFGAFYGCTGLTSIKIPSGVTTIGRSAFAGCTGLTSIINLNPVPQSITSGVFSHSMDPNIEFVILFPIDDVFSPLNLSALTLTVPAGSKALYEAADVWKDFGTIVEISPSGPCATPVAWDVFGEGNALTWTLCPDSTLTISGTGAMPNSLLEFQYPWHSYRSSIRTVVVEDGVTSIGYSAFSGCIGLTSIMLPASVTTIGANAFARCTSLTSIEVASDNAIYASENGVLFNKTKTELITCPAGKSGNYTLPASVTSIGAFAFTECIGLTSIMLPASVTSIGANAFDYCIGLTSITNLNPVPQSITANVFNGFNLSARTLIVPAGSKAAYQAADVWKDFGTIIEISLSDPCAIPVALGVFGVLTWKLCPDSTLTISGTGAMPDYQGVPCGSYRSSIRTVVVEDGVTNIGHSAFAGFTVLRSITLPASVTTIGGYAFNGCSSLTSITLPDSVTTIGSFTFSGCSGLTSITIPINVTSIDPVAFWDCINLTSIEAASDNPAYSSENGVLFNKTKTALITYPGGKSGVYMLPASVTSIERDAFASCFGLTSITLPSSVTTIGLSAFHECYGLTSITLPASVTSIERWAFNDCTGLTSVTNLNPIPQNITADVFNLIDLSTLTLTVPAGSKVAYQAAPVWKDFGTIVEQSTPTVNVTGVSLSKTSLSLQAGDAEQLTAIVLPSNASNKSVGWSSSDESVVRVTDVGRVTAIGAGKATVTVRTQNGGFTAACAVTVTDPSAVVGVTGIVLQQKSVELTEGDTLQLAASVVPANATNRSLFWSSSSGSVAVVSSGGLLTALSEGQTTIAVTTGDGGFTAECAVTVKKKDQSVIVDEGKPAGANGTGKIEISLEIPANTAFTGTFRITLPNGMSVDINATNLSDELKTNMRLVITQESDGSWLFTITSSSLRSLTALSYQNIVNIVYKVDESLANGRYEAVVQDVNLTFDDGTTVAKSEIPVSITVDHSYTGTPSIEGVQKVYISGNMLYVDSPVNETVSVYSVTGMLLYKAEKLAGEIQIPLGGVPNGVLIVRGGSGWVKKELKIKN